MGTWGHASRFARAAAQPPAAARALSIFEGGKAGASGSDRNYEVNVQNESILISGCRNTWKLWHDCTRMRTQKKFTAILPRFLGV